MQTSELARKVLKVLDKQAEYFSTRDRSVLIVSKRMEQELRKECTLEIMKAENGKPQQLAMEIAR